MATTDERTESQRRYIEGVLASNPKLEGRIRRALLVELNRRGAFSADTLHAAAAARAQRDPAPSGDDDNMPRAHHWTVEERHHIREVLLDEAARTLSRTIVDDIVNLEKKRKAAQTLEEIANQPHVPFGLLARKVRRFTRLPRGPTRLPRPESMASRVALIRKVISEQLEFIGVAKPFLGIRFFDDLFDKIVGSPKGAGLIGGKAGGLLLGHTLLEHARHIDASAPDVPFAIPRSFYIRADVLDEFLHLNGLEYLHNHKYRDIEDITHEYPMLLDVCRNADFPPWLGERLMTILEEIGPHPLVVRSSSLLEDRFHTPFAGKYRSVFVANQGTLEERLAELLGAVAEVYASSIHPDPISYRRRHQLVDFDERMAVLVQAVVGQRCGRYLLPVWAGVGLSHNPHRRNPRVQPSDGLAQVVFGLGTRAVDRVGSDVARLIPLGIPSLRGEVRVRDVIGAAQREAAVIDLHRNRFVNAPVVDVLREGSLHGSHHVLSCRDENDHLRPVFGMGILAEPEQLVVTFESFACSSAYPAFLKWSLQTLERAYGCPVEIEFACDGERVYLLQCRPQAMRRHVGPVHVPTDVPPERVLFASTRNVLTGSVHDLEYLVLVDPQAYRELATEAQRIEVGHVIRRVNERLSRDRFALLGPGRWGSRDRRLGVGVGYAAINNARLLVEIASPHGDYVPDASFGSHFFQDLAESNIAYLALYPADARGNYREAFFAAADNQLVRLLGRSAAGELSAVVRVVHVPSEADGQWLHVDMDAEAERALGYLGPPDA